MSRQIDDCLEVSSGLPSKLPCSLPRKSNYRSRRSRGNKYHCSLKELRRWISNTMERGRRVTGASNGDEFKGVGAGAFRHADQHGQPGLGYTDQRPQCIEPSLKVQYVGKC